MRRPFVLVLLVLAVACAPTQQPAPQPPPQYPQPYAQPYGYPPPQGYPQYPPQYPPQGYPPGQYPQPQPPPPQPVPQNVGPPLLPPLIGTLAWQAEVRSVLAELIANLSPANAARVRGIPLVIDPNPNDVNAFAGCDEQGAPFIAGTEGLLEAIDAISQTQANDDLYGTHLYDQYTNAVMPRLASPQGGSAALPPGILPATTLMDPRRLSHAHELFDELVAFTFGHELGHHYLGHTGCANGQGGSGPNLAQLGQIAINIMPGLNQPNEIAADSAGCINELDAGRARRPQYRWTERGAVSLLDYFARLERAAGVSPLNPIGFLRTHPNPAIRLPIVQAVARTWYLQHPGA